MRQQKIAAYRNSAEGKVSKVLKQLKDVIHLEDKISGITCKLDKLTQSLTTEKDEIKRQGMQEHIQQYQNALAGYEEEKQSRKLESKDAHSFLNHISQVLDTIKSLPPKEENEKRIHKNLKHLNRFEEHLLITKCKCRNQEIITQIMKLIQIVNEKRNEQITFLNSNTDDHNTCQFRYTIQDVPNYEPIEGTPTSGGDLDKELEVMKIVEPQPPIVEQLPIVEQPVQQEKQQILQEHEKCQICYDKKKKFIAIPCGHFIYCQDCSKLVIQQMTCLLCRQSVWQMTQVFD